MANVESPSRFKTMGTATRAAAENGVLNDGSAPPVNRTVRQRLWIVASGVGSALLGLTPHVLHHVGLFAGALFAGAGGSVLFGVIGFLAAIPFLRRIHRRTGTWRLPAGLLALMAVIFSISTFVVGPAISGSDSGKSPSNSGQQIEPATPGSTQKKDAHGH